MKTLFKHSSIRVSNVEVEFVRYLYDEIEWEDRLIGITGARGLGKITLMLQYMKNNFGTSYDALYVSFNTDTEIQFLYGCLDFCIEC